VQVFADAGAKKSRKDRKHKAVQFGLIRSSILFSNQHAKRVDLGFITRVVALLLGKLFGFIFVGA
jgi:hypothetical protein